MSRRIARLRNVPSWSAVLLALASLCALAGCTGPYDNSGAPASGGPGASCSALLDRVVKLERAGQVGNGSDELSATIEALRVRECPQEWEVFTDYASAKAGADLYDGDLCSSLRRHIVKEARTLLRQDGLCSKPRKSTGTGSGDGSFDSFLATAAPEPQGPAQGNGDGMPWDQAISHVGSRQRGCGPLAGIGASQDDVFLNLGRDYPDSSRFTVVLWDVGGIEPVPSGSTVCVAGSIVNYQGVAQIQLYSLDAVEVYR